MNEEDVILLSLLVLLVKSKSKMALQFGMKAMNMKSSTESFEENWMLMAVIFDTIGSGTLAELGGNLNTFHKDPELAAKVGERIDVDVSTAIRLQAQWMKNPMDAPVFTELPRAVIFLARIITLLRKDCELLHRELSVVAVWAPYARRALKKIKSEGSDNPMIDLALALPENPTQTSQLEAFLTNMQKNPEIITRFITASDRLSNPVPHNALSTPPYQLVPSTGTSRGVDAPSDVEESTLHAPGMKEVGISLLEMLTSLVELSGESFGHHILEHVHEWLDVQDPEDVESVVQTGTALLKSKPETLHKLGVALKELQELEPSEVVQQERESGWRMEEEEDLATVLSKQKGGSKEVLLRSVRFVSAVADIVQGNDRGTGVGLQLNQLELALLDTSEAQVQLMISILVFYFKCCSSLSAIASPFLHNPRLTAGAFIVVGLSVVMYSNVN
uniref:Uncharacterized protein n=1 Tax=Polyblepharides amylifera TaxID=1486889 RepID=A0A7R9SV50_9CHLO